MTVEFFTARVHRNFYWHFLSQPPVCASITEQQTKEEKVRLQSARFCQGAACRDQDPTPTLGTKRGIKDDRHNSSITNWFLSHDVVAESIE
jgi:hypothetical protein